MIIYGFNQCDNTLELEKPPPTSGKTPSRRRLPRSRGIYKSQGSRLTPLVPIICYKIIRHPGTIVRSSPPLGARLVLYVCFIPFY